ncbi:hypothetical protein WJX84_003316 [Apatococcus fuscideae]|uniref:Uncharacterized protein n=1 Tax=Apatococcus fuscideae TaxID=2026836 RepID=A0AAW1ST88_9CHLO
MAQGFRELPQRKLRPNNRKQQNKQRDAGPSRLSKATFIDMPDSQDDHEPSTKALTADTATQQPMSPANADEAPFPGLMPPRSPNHTVADASADLHGNPAPIAESGLQEIRVNYASPAKIAPDEAPSAPLSEVPKTTTPAPLFPSGRQIKTPAAALHINNECAKIWALSDTRLRRLGLTVEPPSTQTIPAYYGNSPQGLCA